VDPVLDRDAPEPSGDAPRRKWLALFVSPVEKRPRALVRLALHFVLLFVAIVVIALLARSLPGWLIVVLDLVVAVAVTWAAARFFDRRSFIDLGLRIDRRRSLDLGAGAVVGALSIGLVALLELALGVSRFAAVAIDAHRLEAAGVAGWFFLAVAIQEELVFRGYHVVNLAEGLSGRRLSRERASVVAVAISSGVFGLAHASNDGATVLSTLNIAIGGGCLLSIGLLLSGELAFSIGLHLTWNLGQCLLGMPVSGFVMSGALVSREASGADWLTGGSFGPEAGALGLAGMVFGSALALIYARVRYGPFAVRLHLRPAPAPISS
jgi:membrane protease YdiL (CAAX protease family)